MRIAVLGSGAMGSVYASKFFEAGYDVTVIDTWLEHIKAIMQNGLLIDGLGNGKYHKLKASNDPSQIGIVDLIIVLVKSHDTAAAIEAAFSLIGPETAVMSLQNGIGNVEALIEAVGEKHVIGGVTSHGSYVVGPGHIHHAAAGYTSIGELSGRITTRIKKIGGLFQNAGLMPVTISSNISELIWKKLMINVALNAISALCGIRNGQVFDLAEAREISILALEEAAAVAKAKGIEIDYDPVEVAREVSRDTALNRSSMLQDISAKRATEINVINGAIVRAGEALCIPTPVNRTLTALISIIQRTYNSD